jgi:hypothetical protein
MTDPLSGRRLDLRDVRPFMDDIERAPRGYWRHVYSCRHIIDRRSRAGDRPRTQTLLWDKPCGYCAAKLKK